MPLARTNTSRTKSRSPAPPVGFQGSSSRAFLPPAHYAAAGGMTYSDGPRPVTSNCSSPSTNSRSVDFTPLVPMTSDSSFEFKPASDSRLGTISPGSRGKRQSNLGNLPLLEAHLLPSLRDTVDRMTRPPSRVSATTALPSPASNLQPPSRSGRSLSPSCPPVSSADTLRTPSTPQPPSSSKSPSIPQSVIPTTRDPLQGKQKSALKSALRSPTPKPSTLQALVTDLFLPSSNGSSRSVKGITGSGRKATQIPLATLTSPTDEATGAGTAWQGKSVPKNYKANDKPPSGRNGRTRSRTDPGAPPKSSATLSPSTTTPQPNTFISGLPRRLDPLSSGKFGRKDSAYHTIGSSSEIENRYEKEGRDRRKLIVTNAAIVSSSSSESEVEVRTPDKGAKLPIVPDRWNRARGSKGWEDPIVGLGFDLEDGGTQHVVEPSRDEDDELSVYDDDDEEQLDSGPSSIKFPLFLSQDDGMTSDDSRKRQEALLGIVDGLDLGLGSAPDDRNEESDYCGQEGLAISGSGDVSAGFDRNVNGGGYTGQDDSGDGSEHPFENNCDNSVSSDQVFPNGRLRREHEANFTQSTPILMVSTEYSHRKQGRIDPDPRRSTPQLLNCPPPSDPSRPCSPRCNPRRDEDRPGHWKGEKSRRSPSRSPVIRQSVGVPLPAALRRHSFYDGNASMHPGSNLDTDYSQRRLADDQPYTQKSDTSLAENSYAATAREKKAFGIPPSESDDVYRQGDGTLPHASSDLSSVGSSLWQDDCEGLSMGAEELFRKLSGSHKEGDRSCHQGGDALSRSRAKIPRSSSPASGYENTLADPWQKPRQDSSVVRPSIDRTWRSSLPQRVYQSLHERHGEMEMQRQEVIWNFCETEELFVNRLLSMVRLFIRPLRAQDSNTWITGVPLDVARLLDWVEDIVNLHTQILSVLQTTRHDPSQIAEMVAEPLRSFVPRLEVYQPYLVRLEEVAGTILHLMQDRDNDFSEFVKIQERGSTWTLHSCVMEPQARLQQYPVIFRRLRDVTPKDHPDYLSTFSLLHSTDFVIRVLNEVKNREDEYDLIKDISTRLQGLPPTVQLARRERRLLAHGLLQCIDTGNFALGSSSTSTPPLEVDHLSIPSCQGDKDTQKRGSRLVDAINEWDIRRGRSGSVKSNASSSTAMSFKSYETTSSDSTPSSDFPSYCKVVSPFQTPHEGPQYPKSYSHSYMRSKHLLAAAPISQQNETLKPIPVHAFVFTDIVVLALPVQDQCQDDRQAWQLPDRIGVTRILGITESPDSGPQILLDLLPVKARGPDAGLILDNSSILSVRLELPGSPFSTSRYSDDGVTRRKWLAAFHQCFQFTLRSLSFPSYSGDHLYGPNTDLASDTEQSILSILATGLPLPKSPSAQIQVEHYENDKQQEREERGWWSLRFQQVLRELQRRLPGT